MSIEPNDPRLTAYALGELEAEDLASFEALLAEDEAARSELSAIRQTTALLTNELQSDDVQLSREGRARIESALPSKQPAKVSLLRKKSFWAISAVAAALPLTLVALATLNQRAAPQLSEQAGKIAMLDEPAPVTAPAPMATAPADLKSKAMGPPPLGRADRGEIAPDRQPDHNTESYDSLQDNPFISVKTDPRSTFSIDVDTASYSLVRRFLTQNGRLPPKGAVRIEEMINYFSYQYPQPNDGKPFSVTTEVNQAPWAKDHRLVRIGIKAKEVTAATRPPVNLVFLLDVSGSMNAANKLPLLKRAFRMLVEQLDHRDRVSIVVYAGASGLVLPPTAGDQQGEILAALDRLEAGGSTNAGDGIELAYAMAEKNFEKGGVNRVLLATDGDFNVGVTNQSDLVDLVQNKAKSGVFLSVLGFGMGNYKDSTLEKLADKGNGNYAYVDSASEARKVLGEQAAGTLITVAKDVKIQVEMNPAVVQSFRLIGYENRVLAHQDFNDDTKDAGDIGAGHTVTALYEIVPVGAKPPQGGVDDLKYQAPGQPSAAAASGELLTLKLRYKQPDGNTSQLLEFPVRDGGQEPSRASTDFRFASAVAGFGMLLRDSPHKGTASYQSVLSLAREGVGSGRDQSARRELVGLIEKAQELK
ncbi:MAG: von Willebrand factor type A domain-containing protein [Polyangiaceae bacterium]|nr:von Willebrand factor type A domain-containing protein [Polyangiaceae bacterium]